MLGISPVPNHSREPTAGSPKVAAVEVEQAHRQLVVENRASPRAIENIARVAMNGATRPYATESR